jgi:hypothetical protein
LALPAGKTLPFRIRFVIELRGRREHRIPAIIKAERAVNMKKMIGMVALCVFGLAVASSLAQAPVAPAAPAAAPVAAVAAPAAAVAAPAAQDLTIKGKVSVVNGPDGMLQAIYINPADPESHGYKVDIVNGEGKTLADKGGKTVEVTGVDANRLLNIKTVVVVE